MPPPNFTHLTMDLSDCAVCFSLLVNIGLASALAVHFRRGVRDKKLNESRAKFIYSWLCLGVGLFAGCVVLLGLVWLFTLPVGHGVLLIVGPLANLLLTALLILMGRIAIGWAPIRW